MNFEEAIKFAIDKEIEAQKLYSRCKEIAQNKSVKKMFEELVQQEKGHEEMLRNLDLESVKSMSKKKEIEDLKISDYLEEKTFDPGISYREALVMAMKREEESKELYNLLAEKTQERDIKKLFETMAKEEAKHKHKLEIEYDENILSEN